MKYNHKIVSEEGAERFLEKVKNLISAGYRPVGGVKTVFVELSDKKSCFFSQGYSLTQYQAMTT